MVLSSRVVAVSLGPVAGCTVMTAASPAALSTGPATAVTPGRARSLAASAAGAWSWVRSTATSSGAFAPGPYSAVTRSYACRTVLPAGWVPASPGQVRMPRTGAASASRTATEATAISAGRRVTHAAHASDRKSVV